MGTVAIHSITKTNSLPELQQLQPIWPSQRKTLTKYWLNKTGKIELFGRLASPEVVLTDILLLQYRFFDRDYLNAEHVMTERSKYQKTIIKNYYENRESIALQRAQELVTELYLSDGKKRGKHWKSLANHLSKLNVKQETIEHLIQQDDPQLAARMVEKLTKTA
jgi:hypothetical protein